MTDPGVLNWPEAQGIQEVWPREGVYWFAGQLKQLVIPDWLAKVPGEQGVGFMEEGRGQIVPAAQDKQALISQLPVDGLYVPCALKMVCE
jgi:hypothetical protein